MDIVDMHACLASLVAKNAPCVDQVINIGLRAMTFNNGGKLGVFSTCNLNYSHTLKCTIVQQ
jgi:hypothetical protein